MSKERLTFIDGLRGIAIIGVILTHASSIINLRGTARYFVDVGGMGVQLFFVISAFTIFYSLAKSEGLDNQFRDFYIRRLFRIIPVYWLGIILYTAIYGLESRGWGEKPEMWHIPYNILLVNIFHPSTSSSVVPGGWSISCEVIFYLMVPLLYKYFNTNRSIAFYMFLTMIVLPLGNMALKAYSIETIFSGYEPDVIDNFYYRWIPSQLACFGFGIILFKLYQNGSYRLFITRKTINVLLVSVVTLMILGGKRFKVILPEFHHIYSLLFMLLALLLSVRPWKIFVNKFTVFLGKISYSGYLLHFLVIKQTTNIIERYFPSVSDNTYLYFIIVAITGFVFTIPLAYLSYTFIELKAVRLGKELINRLNIKFQQA